MSLKEFFKEVPGKSRGDVVVFTLSTCGWCRKVKLLLNELGVGYRYVDFDLLQGQARKEALGEIDQWNPSHSFPTLIIDNDVSIVGYHEQKIREALQC